MDDYMSIVDDTIEFNAHNHNIVGNIYELYLLEL